MLLAALALTGVALSPIGMRGLVSGAALSGLRFWDAFHLALEPHLEHTRAPQRKDFRPLGEQAAAMEADLDAVFTVVDGGLYLMDTAPSQVGDVCLWQGVFAAEAALRAEHEGSPASRRRASAALEGLAALTSRGRPLARAFYPAWLPIEPPGLWYGRDSASQWKEDASVDSLSGWVFGLTMVGELSPELRPRVDRLAVGFAAALKGAGYRLRNSNGTLTRYNTVGGALLNSPTGVLSTMTVLRLAARAEPSGPWAAEHARFVAQGQDRWGAYGSGPGLWRNTTTNHNIAFLALAAAVLSEEDPARRIVYARGLVRLSRLTEKMGNSFWTYLALWTLGRAGLGDPGADGEVALWLARRREHVARARVAMLEWDYPANKVKREVVNSTRPEIAKGRWPLSGRLAPRQPLPVWQRPPADFVWQRTPYSLDDWVGYRADPPQRFAPLDFLVAYRLGVAVGGVSPDD